MARPAVAVIGLLLSGATLCVVALWNGRTASTGPPPVVIGPKAVLLRTPDSFGHTAVAFSPDGRTVAAGRVESSGAVVSLCDLASGRQRATIKGSSVEFCAVAFSPDGRTLAVGKNQGVSLYDPDTGHERASLDAEYAFDPLGLAFSSDGRRLAAATVLGRVIVWDIGTSRKPVTIEAHTRSVEGVSLSPDGQLVASASDGPIVCHWYGPFGLPPQVFGVAGVGCGPDYGIVRLFDLSTGQELGNLKHKARAHSVSFSPDGKLLASGGGGAAKLWDLAAGSASTIIDSGDGVEVYCISFSPDGLTLAVGLGSRDSGGSRGEVRLWDLKMGHVRAVLSGRRGKVRSLAFSPDGKALVTGSGEAVVLWDLPAAMSPGIVAGKAESF
jgi:WD40 repeat protein